MKGSVNTKYKCYVLCSNGIGAPQKTPRMYSPMLYVSNLEEQDTWAKRKKMSR